MLSPREHKALSKALMAWGALSRLELGESLGALSSNVLSHLSTLGLKISTHHRGVQWSADAAHIDRLINQLYQQKPKWASAIMWHYTEPGDIRGQASTHGLAKSTYHEQIQKGREWLGREWRRLH